MREREGRDVKERGREGRKQRRCEVSCLKGCDGREGSNQRGKREKGMFV